MTSTTATTDPIAEALDAGTREQIVIQLHDAGFAGEIVGPDDAAYDATRQVWNAMVDKHPGLIVRCTSTADVVAAVNAARDHGQPPSIRCGGHNVAGKALTDGGITIDLSTMSNVVVEPDERLVHVDGGCQLGDVDAATAPHGLIVPAGIMSETGVGGLALGGGIGWMSRQHGLTCDNFVSLEVVLASGEVVEASADRHADLFWALRGGGGNFGVVTRFTIRAYAFGPMIRLGVALYGPDEAAAALREYAQVAPTLPNHVGFHAALKPSMPPLPFVPPELVGERAVMLIAMWLEDAEDPAGEEMIDRLRSLGTPLVSDTTVMPFAAGLQRLINTEFEDGHRYYTKEAHCDELSDEAIDILVDFWLAMPMDGEVELIQLGGAITDVAEEDTAFSNRRYGLWFNFAMRWDDATKDSLYMGMTRKTVEDLRPWTGTGVYVNMLNVDEQDRVVEAFGKEKYAKLGRIKATYDPGNFFRVNANITPMPGDDS